MPQLSVVIITYNEERNIRRCLDSAIDVADDIVVVDSVLTDKTKEICAEFGVTFIEHRWKGYSSTKNFANNRAKYDWILSLDADEELSEELKQSILEAKKGEIVTYQFNRLTNYCGQWIRHGGWYPDTKVRLFDRRNTEWQGNIHENLHFHHPTAIKTLKGDLHHYSYYTVEEHYQRAEKYSRLKAEKLKAKGKTYNALLAYLSAAWKFFQMYVLKLGFLDGKYGFIIAKISVRGVLMQYQLLR